MIYLAIVLVYFLIRRKTSDVRIVVLFLNVFFVIMIPPAILLGKPDAASALGELAFLFYFISVLEVLINIYKNRQLLK